MIILDLSWQFLQHFLSQHYSIVMVMRKLNELHEISECSVALRVGHLAVIVVEFVHGAPVLTVSYSDDDDT